VVNCTNFENWRGFAVTVGSNPSLSERSYYDLEFILVLTIPTKFNYFINLFLNTKDIFMSGGSMLWGSFLWSRDAVQKWVFSVPTLYSVGGCSVAKLYPLAPAARPTPLIQL